MSSKLMRTQEKYIKKRLSRALANHLGTISYAYDAAGNLTELTYPDGTVLNYTYNSLNLPTTATETTNTLNVAYDSCGRRNSETIPNDINVTYQYDANGRLPLVRHQLAETVLAQTGYTLDNNGNRLSIQDEQSRQTNFTYDDLNQLIQAAYPDNTSIDYLYDAVGNRRTMAGNIPADLDNTNAGYQYDYEDRLTSVTDAEKTINYIYDGDGNLIGKTITTGTTTETYEYIYDYSAGLPRVLVEKKNGTEIFDYFYLGRLYARKGSEGTIYYHQDGLGSILAITDASGNVLNKYTYDAFGTPKAIECINSCYDVYTKSEGSVTLWHKQH